MSDIFKYPSWYYTPEELRINLTDTQIKQEYQRLRRIAMKRLNRLDETNMATRNWTERRREKFKASSKIPIEDMPYMLTEIERYLRSAYSTVSGRRKVQMETMSRLREAGYDFINSSNIERFYEFMEWVRENKLSRMYDSEQIVELFNLAEAKNIRPESLKKDFNGWMSNIDRLEKIPRQRNRKYMTLKELHDLINKGE